MNYRDLVNRLEAIESRVDEAAIANPYKDPAQAAIFNAMSDADQAWLTKGGGVPDITDKYILMRAPNGGKPDPAKAAAAATAAATTTPGSGQGAKPAEPRGGEFVKANLAKLAELVAKLEATKKPMESTDYDIANQLIESFGYETNENATASLGKAALGSAGGALAKALPGVGLALGAKDAYDRFQKGDYTGAGIAGLSGVTSLVPGLGTAATLGLSAANLARDYKRGEFDNPATAQAAAPAQAAKPARTGDPKVMALQKQLIAKGAKIQADGVMGPATQAAMKQFPLSVAENIALLRDQLAMLETMEEEEVTEVVSDNDEEQTDEGVLGALGKGISKFGQGISTGFNKGALSAGTAARTGMANKAGNAVGRAGKAVTNNPGKAALGATAAGAGLGLALGGGAGAAAKPERPAGGAGGAPAKPAAPTAPTATGLTPEQQELIKQIQATMGSLADVEDPTVVAGLQTAQSAISRFGDNKPQSAMDNATAAAAQSAALATPAPTSGQAAKPALTPQQQAQNILQPGMNK